MGAWRTIRHRLEEAAGGVPVRYVGRPWRASTAEGYPTAHVLEQDRIVRAALERSTTAGASGSGLRLAAALRLSTYAFFASRGPCALAWASRILRCFGGMLPPDLPRGERGADRSYGANALGMPRLFLRCDGYVNPEPCRRVCSRGEPLNSRAGRGEWRSSRRKACRPSILRRCSRR